MKYTFGIDPLQQYLIEFPDGRLQALSLDHVAWARAQQSWWPFGKDDDPKKGLPVRFGVWRIDRTSGNAHRNFTPATVRKVCYENAARIYRL